MNLQKFHDVGHSADARQLRSRLIGFADELGFPIMTAVLVVDRPGPGDRHDWHVLDNVPEGYRQISRDPEISRRDPVTRRMKAMSVPLVYDQSTYAKEGCEELWERQAPYGFRTGVAVALHMSGGRHFLLGMDREDPLPARDEQLIEMLGRLQLLAVHAQSAATRLLEPKSKVDEDPTARLTPREVEILKWTMQGKSSWEAGTILGISERTVNFHVLNACGKLGVSSKHQAVLKAMQMGVL